MIQNLLMMVNQLNGCDYTISFDAKAAKLSGMVKLDPPV